MIIRVRRVSDLTLSEEGLHQPLEWSRRVHDCVLQESRRAEDFLHRPNDRFRSSTEYTVRRLLPDEACMDRDRRLAPPPPLSVCYRIVPCHHRPPASSLPGGRAWRYLCTHPVRRQSSRLPRFPSSRQRPRHPPGNTTLLSLSLCIWPNIIIYKYHYNKTHLSSSPPTYFPSHSNVLDDKSAEACRGDEKGGNFTKNYEDTKGSCVARNLMKDVNITPVSRTLEYKKLKTVTPKISPHIS